MILDTVLQLPQKLRYKLFDAPKGYGRRVATEVLEQQFKDGFWKFLDSSDELANYMVAVGYVQHLAKTANIEPRLLDLGCGHGNLAELLCGYPVKAYLGLDVSAEAIQQATSRQIRNSIFQVADVGEWIPKEKFDFILSTGSVCYFRDPAAFLLRYSSALNPGGAFIVSLWRYGHNSAIWRNIEEHFDVVDSTLVTNHKGQMWDVKVLRQK